MIGGFTLELSDIIYDKVPNNSVRRDATDMNYNHARLGELTTCHSCLKSGMSVVFCTVKIFCDDI